MRERSSGASSDQTPESKVARAEAIAFCASSRDIFGTVPTTSSVAGLITSKVSPSEAAYPLAAHVVAPVADLARRLDRHARSLSVCL